ncbi:MAG: DUF192 domain-containing protein [Coleofasciculus sp. C3-bin4]|nr:DUF192 domain-containing protein [Coleofasciculus sp. C3-bin4]
MKSRIRLLGITLSILLMSCAASAPTKVSEATPLKSGEQLPAPPVVSSSPTNSGQMLPISAQAQMAGQRIMLEVARTPQEQAMGLMYRTSLAPDRGMLFSFDPPQPVSFWMKNTIIPLDMVFIRDGEVKAIAANVPPCTTTPCPTYGPQVEVLIDQVIEIRGGRAAELGLKVGDQVIVKFGDGSTTPPADSPS